MDKINNGCWAKHSFECFLMIKCDDLQEYKKNLRLLYKSMNSVIDDLQNNDNISIRFHRLDRL